MSQQIFTETDLAWAAGFIDGEGCIGIYTRTRPDRGFVHRQHGLVLSVYNSEPSPLLRLQRLFGGSITSRKRQSPKHRRGGVWVRQDQKAGEILRLIRPHLTAKANQADVALRYLESRQRLPGYGKGGLSPEVLAERDALQYEIAALKTIVYPREAFRLTEAIHVGE